MLPRELKESDFNLSKKSIKNPNKPLSVLFIYLDWCTHCRNFKPIYNETAKILGSSVGVYQIDSDKSPELMKSFNISHFPTILLFDKNGKLIKEYTGPRQDPNVFIASLCKMALCPSSVKK